MSQKNSPSMTLLFLAGGQGSRVGGADKGLEVYEGKLLIERAIDKHHQPPFLTVISANRNLEQYRKFDLPIVTDESWEPNENKKPIPKFEGPLAGIMAALNFCKTDLLMVIPVDMPLLPDDYVSRLYQEFISSQGAMGYIKTKEREHYLNCIFSTELKPLIKLYYADGGRSLRGLLERVNAVGLKIGIEEEQMANFNRTEDFKKR